MSSTHRIPVTTAGVVSFAAVLALLGSMGSALLVVEPAGAANSTLFVLAGGSDTNPCTAAAPCATVSHALSLVVSGDTIEVAGRIFDVVTVGTPITIEIEHWPGHPRAVIDGTGHSNTATIVNSGGGNLTLDRLTVTGGVEGGVYNDGTLTLTDSTITGNAAIGDANSGDVTGGVLNLNQATISDSTIAGNTATTKTGGVQVAGGIINTEYIVITDSTITNNTASASSNLGADYVVGGVLDNGFSFAITNSTITNNRAGGNVDGGPITGGVEGTMGALLGTPVSVGATIVSGNRGGYGDCSGTVVSTGYNLTDSTKTTCGFTQPTDKFNARPHLGSLAFNGGPTETKLPAPNSPTVGVIPSPTTLNGVPVCGPGAFDQRGVPRPSPGPNCTIGAVERSQ
jgi:hypothetical protein